LPEISILHVRAMRILLDNGGYHLGNLGDNALLLVACSRFKKLWPEAELFAITHDGERLRRLVPYAVPVESADRQAWFRQLAVLGELRKIIPWRVAGSLRRFEIALRSRFPRAYLACRRLLSSRETDELSRAQAFLALVESVDVVALTGGGYITDSFSEHALCALELILLAKGQGKTTCALGQGLGPISDRTLRYAAERAFKSCDVVAMRESVFGPRLFSALHGDPEKVIVTGDDAIEPAFERRPGRLGERIGVNIRLAAYAGSMSENCAALRTVIRDFASRMNRSIEIVPIALSVDLPDAQSTSDMLGLNAQSMPADPGMDEVLERVAACRIVITGSYHAGVFALSQGASVVALVCSDYYHYKFSGLRHQFGDGIRVIDLRLRGWAESLPAAIEDTWSGADSCRAESLAAAEHQVAQGKRAYELVRKHVEQSATLARPSHNP
jgi:polysaccharide pyruvyl transferase WcaK-like protein